MKLRAYQSELIRLAYADMRAGRTRVVLVGPTGSGKTCIGSEVVRQGVERGRSVIWLVHRRELVDQTCAEISELGLEVGAIAASSAWPVRPGAPVQVASVQTLASRESIRPPAHLLVWDECHHAGEAAAEWIKVLDAYPGIPMLGLTATAERGDGTGLAPIFTGIVQIPALSRQLIAEGHLVQCEVDRPSSWLKSRRQAGNPLAQDPVDRYLEIGGGRPGFLFARSVDESEAYAARLRERGVNAVSVSDRTSADERAAAIAGFRAGSVQMLCNVYVFTEGTNLTRASCCVLACHPSTAGGFLQRVGRVLRPHAGKRDALLIDCGGVSHVWGMPEDERLWRLEGKACVRLGAKCGVCGQPIEDYPCPNCGYAPEPEERDGGESEILNEPMAKFARKIAEGPQQREQTFDCWVAAARLKGWKLRSVGHKWRAVYGTPIEQEPWWRGWPQ